MASSAKSALATILRILGLTTGTGGIDTVSLGAGGTGYTLNDILTVVQGGGSGGTVKATGVSAGVVTAVTRQAPGTGYAVANGLATTGGTGTGCTVNILTLLLPIAELQNISGPSGRLNLVDVTNHDSPSGYSESIAGVADGGEVSIEGNFLNDVSQSRAISDHQGKITRNFEMAIPLATPAKWTFTGYFTALDEGAKFDDKLGFTATVKISGKPVLA